ncbi:response regulator rcp1 [bacterium BMS3Bbin06]|nr:response regulator rcp1 [bacterium BMS3Abin08]GBE34914.1 response regulator rcp1 [bacterium BMS3Bbin06]HDO36253.1 response regulator [Nitrospirota bacterium]HDY71937.1 response regulator [Nitrospirota bacterium]
MKVKEIKGVEDYTVLLVEDDPNDVILIRRAFEKARILNPFKVVHNGEEAVSYLRGEGRFADRGEYPLPILIILDLKMPRMSGLEFLQWLSEEQGMKRIIVVVLTSSNEAPDINLAYELGANSYLVKPVQFDDLMRIVRELHLYWLVMSEKPEI